MVLWNNRSNRWSSYDELLVGAKGEEKACKKINTLETKEDIMKGLTLENCKKWLKCYSYNTDLSRCSACEGEAFCLVVQDEIGTVLQMGDGNFEGDEEG